MRGNFKISIPTRYLISMPDMTGAETNPDFSIMFDKYSTNILKRGWETFEDGEYISSQVKDLVVNEFLLITAFGGKVENFAPRIQLDSTLINDAIPEGLPNRTYEVAGEAMVHTWATWNDGMTSPVDNGDGTHTISSTPFAAYLPSEVLLQIHGLEGIELID